MSGSGLDINDALGWTQGGPVAPEDHVEDMEIPPEEEIDDDEVGLMAHPHTDAGSAERLIAWFRGGWRFVPERDRWAVWDGRVWDYDSAIGSRTTVAAIEMARALHDQGCDVGGEDGERIRKFARRLEGGSRLRAAIDLARHHLITPQADFDRDEWALNVANGSIDLRSGVLLPHRKERLQTRIVDVPYRPDAECPRWEQFLLEVMDGDQDLVDFLRRAVGYSLSASTAEQVMFVTWGSGANGKSTFLETVRELLGSYSTQADFSAFAVRQGDSARNDLARLAGARFVSASESGQGKHLDEAVVKQLTGSDTVTARFLFREFFEFRPVAKIWLATNHRPTITGTDHAIWRRIRLIPFQVTIPPEARDRGLPAALRREAPGILAWAVRGCLEWLRDGLREPEGVRLATEEYREDMDRLAPFIEEELIVHPSASVRTSKLYRVYREWAEEAGLRPLSQRSLGLEMKSRGFHAHRSHGRRWWFGVGLQVRGAEVESEAGE